MEGSGRIIGTSTMNISNFHPSSDIHVQTTAVVTGMVADKPIEIHYNDCTDSGQLPDFYGRPMEYGRPLYFCPVISIFFLFFPRLISAVRDWMFTTLTHMVWP